jgi:hypothetical protein
LESFFAEGLQQKNHVSGNWINLLAESFQELFLGNVYPVRNLLFALLDIKYLRG